MVRLAVEPPDTTGVPLWYHCIVNEAVDVMVETRGSRRAAMLEEVFRGLAYAWFVFGAGTSGAFAIWCVAADVGVWGWVAAFFCFLGGMFWTLFLWAFLLLCSSLAGYLGERM